MNRTRTLTLKREVLARIDDDRLGGLVGGAPPTRYNCDSVVCSDTCYSCLHYISCHITDCILEPAVIDTSPTG